MISHEIPLIFRVSDKMLILNNGEKIFENTKEELAKQEKILEAIKINMPPVVKLSKYFQLPSICYNVESFVKTIVEQINGKES